MCIESHKLELNCLDTYLSQCYLQTIFYNIFNNLLQDRYLIKEKQFHWCSKTAVYALMLNH